MLGRPYAPVAGDGEPLRVAMAAGKNRPPAGGGIDRQNFPVVGKRVLGERRSSVETGVAVIAQRQQQHAILHQGEFSAGFGIVERRSGADAGLRFKHGTPAADGYGRAGGSPFHIDDGNPHGETSFCAAPELVRRK